MLGSNSFTAGHFINYLLDNTDSQVIGVSRSNQYDALFLPFLYENKESQSNRFVFHRLNINTQFDQLCEICNNFQPTAVINFAAQGEVRHSWQWPEQWYQTNALSAVRLMDFLTKQSYLQRYIAISTPEVYGSTILNIKENHHYMPSTPYAVSKLTSDLHGFANFKRYGFPFVVTRAANLYGIHQQLYRIIPRTIIYLKLGKTLELHGQGKSKRAFIHARDVADFTYKTMCLGRSGEVYHCAPQERLVTIAELVRLICDMMGKDFESSVKLVAENFGQDNQYSLDSTKAREQLGFEEQVTIETGIQEMIHWIESNWNRINTFPFDYMHKI